MIPSVVSRQVRDTMLDYLRTTFSLSDPEFERALFEFIDSNDGIFKGPFVDIRLPFRKADAGERIPLDIRPSFAPYRHQLRAFRRLYSRDGHQPQHTLVTTGTGSGKTECFLYPILDHCWRHRDEPGVKAILLYPMNALATDQARRIAELLWNDERLKGEVSAALYVGGKGAHPVADREHLVDKREIIRDSPPDILLTNYRMLDFLLLRPEDGKLWRNNGPETLRYLVLDELHTYDGAQGSDVACLIRRLKGRLNVARGSICCVGTSATIGGKSDRETSQELTGFATDVFAEDFFEETVITEDRADAGEVLGDVIDIDTTPDASEVPAALDRGSVETWIREQAAAWTGGAGETDRVELGRLLARHSFLRQVLRALGGRLRPMSEIDAWLGEHEPGWSDRPQETRTALLESFLALVSWARHAAPTDGAPGRTVPFLTVQVQPWIRELRRPFQKLPDAVGTYTFDWAHELGAAEVSEDEHWFPIAYCRDCGSNGIAGYQREQDTRLHSGAADVGQAWLHREPTARYVTVGHDADAEINRYLCPKCARLTVNETCQCRMTETVPGLPVRVSDEVSRDPRRFLARCPDCGEQKTLSILGSRAPSLLSVAISHLHISAFNDDPKLIAFTDSVQDATHRAGFFGARTYRFNLRTAFQGLVEKGGDGLTVAGSGEALMRHWHGEMPVPELIATLMPPDLAEHPSFKDFLSSPSNRAGDDVARDLARRLAWEVTLEYGLNSRVGRTLETTRCSTAYVPEEDVREVASLLRLELTEDGILDHVPASALDVDRLAHFVRVFLNRLRVRGGTWNPMLDAYVQRGGGYFHLTKRRQPLMSPFGSRSPLPRFLTDRLPDQQDRVFDALYSSPGRGTWARDWAKRALEADSADSGMNTLYKRLVETLAARGLLVTRQVKNETVWGLSPERLRLTADVRSLACTGCRRPVTVPQQDEGAWLDRPCQHFRCVGTYAPSESPRSAYYAGIYRSGRLSRVFAAEHTGLLSRQDRERVEEAFKNRDTPTAPNLLVATPTLELGIDIGDLSTVILCSVPPTTANHLQRVGRAGRRTGNALCLTLANARPHDLYFDAAPLEMLSGQVLPPGCLLDAPEMLARQYVAHCMDCWARDDSRGSAIPGKTSYLLGGEQANRFPATLLAYVARERESILESFLGHFREVLSDANRERIREFALSDEVSRLIEHAFKEVGVEREKLRGESRRCRERLQDLDENPDAYENPDEMRVEIEETRRLLRRLAEELGNKYPLNVLTDAGVLPNYAFPEPGVTLQAMVTEVRDGQRHATATEYMRPASVALRELAPFNTFYADGRRLRIDELDIGTKQRPLAEKWRFCEHCAHTERESDDSSSAPECPRCHHPGWVDVGQRRTVVHFRRSRSVNTGVNATTTDESDDRERESYETRDLIDVGKENLNGARYIEEIPFGYELLKDLRLREVNFGRRGGGPAPLRVAGTPIPTAGFGVCLDCGRVRDDRGKIEHSPRCRARKEGIAERVEEMYLYREMQSEAIRVLLPVAMVEVDEHLASFKAALHLGFRRRFHGDPVHLQIKHMREPIEGAQGHRQFLVVYDVVPGGTGYLSDLWQGENFLELLEVGLGAMRACPCQTAGRDGCYRCLYAYQAQRELHLISSRRAQEAVEKILEMRDKLEAIATLSDVSLDSRLESELETEFLKTLEAFAREREDGAWAESVVGGERRWQMRLGEARWEIRAQVALGPVDGVAISSRPDFLLRPLGKLRDGRPVAVFCDGFEYHGCPGKTQGRIWDDVQKRTAIIASERYAVWSLTWDDVKAFKTEGDTTPYAHSLFRDIRTDALATLAERTNLALSRRLPSRGSMALLIEYMRRPDPEAWRHLAKVHAIAWLATGPLANVEAAKDLEHRLIDERVRFVSQIAADGDYQDAVLAQKHVDDVLGVLAMCPGRSLRESSLDDVRLVLRLFDEPLCRAEPRFAEGWRKFLHAWNVLQFLESLTVVTSEFIDQGVEFAEPESGREDVVAATESGSELEELFELATADSRSLIEAVHRAGLPLPTLDYELEVEGTRVGPEADLAWTDARIVVLAAPQMEDAPVFETHGWQVLAHPVPPAELLDALRARLDAGTGGEA